MPAPRRCRAALSSIGALAAALIAASAAPSRAHACSCRPVNVKDAYDGAVAVFEGSVKEVGAPQSDAPKTGARRKVRMEVVTAWKGAEGEEVTISTPADSAMCGYGFEVEHSYLVYASAGPAGLEVSLCSRTRPMADASEDLAQLGMGATPVDPKANPPIDLSKGTTEEPPARGGCASCAVAAASHGGVAVTSAAIVLATLSVRRRRRRVTRSRSEG